MTKEQLRKEYETTSMLMGESYEEFLEDKTKKYYITKEIVKNLGKAVDEAKTRLYTMEMTVEDFNGKIDSATSVIDRAIDRYIEELKKLGYKEDFIKKQLDILFDDNLRWLEGEIENTINSETK